MLIYISGMSCTGKTQLVNQISEFSKDGSLQRILGIPPYNSVTVISELTRTMFKTIDNPKYKKFSDLLKNTETYLRFMARVSEELKQTLGKCYYGDPNHLVICDRAPLDYRINLLLNYNTGDPQEMTELASLYSAVDSDFSHLPEANYTFMTDPYSSYNHMEYDGFRPEAFAHRRIIECQYFRLASKLPNIKILPNNSADRLGSIIRTILKG